MIKEKPSFEPYLHEATSFHPATTDQSGWDLFVVPNLEPRPSNIGRHPQVVFGMDMIVRS